MGWVRRSKWWIILFLLLGWGIFWRVQRESVTPLAYNVRGPYAVGVQTIQVEDSTTFDITIWYPALYQESASGRLVYKYTGLFEVIGYALEDAEVDLSAAPYPVILFSHASGGYRLQSTFLAEHLASYGFVVIAPDHPSDTIQQVLRGVDVTAHIPASLQQRPTDLWMALDTVKVEMGTVLDTNRIILAGHSLGATTALLMAGAQIDVDGLNQWCETATGFIEICVFDPREIAQIQLPDPDPHIAGVIALAPWNGPALDLAPLRTNDLPVLILAAEGDQVAPVQRDAFPMFAALDPEQATIVVLAQAGHFVFVDTCPQSAERAGLMQFCSDGVWDMQRAHNQIAHYVTAFSLAVGYEDMQASAALDSDTLLRQLVR